MTKFLTATILGLIATVIAVVLFNHLTNFEIHSFTLWFVIPVGGAIVGMGAGSGLFFGHLWANKPVSRIHYVIGALLGISAFIGIYYVDYLTTYITSDKEINYSFKGDPISSFEIDGTPITFFKYLDIQNQSSSQQIYVRGRPTGQSFETGAAVNYFLFYLQLVTAALAGALVGFAIVGNKKYCQKCKKYNKEKYLFKFDIDKHEEVITHLITAIDDLPKLQKIIKTTTLADNNVNAFAKVDLEYCPECHDSRLLIKVMKKNSNANFDEVDKFRQTIAVKEIITKALLN